MDSGVFFCTVRSINQPSELCKYWCCISLVTCLLIFNPQALKEVLSQESEVYDEQDEETGEFTCIDEAYLEPEKVSNYEHVPMTVSSIFDMRFTAKGTALVIAGETGGISNKAKKLCFDRHGGIVYIPMSQDIDCMTLESATVVCLYEIKRQLLQKMPAKDEEVDEELLDPEA